MVSCHIQLPRTISYNVMSEAILGISSLKYTNFVILDGSRETMLFSRIFQPLVNNVSHPNCICYFSRNYNFSFEIEAKNVVEINFSSDVEDLKETVNSYVGRAFDRYKKYIFVIRQLRFQDEIDVMDVMDTIWRNDIWNFNLIYFNRSVTNFIYNPFLKTMEKTVHITNQIGMFKNLHRYRIRVSMVRTKGELRDNKYFIVLELIEKILNASIVYSIDKDTDESYQKVKTGRSEFTFIGQFYGILKDVKYTEPYKPDHIILMAPKAPLIPQFLKFLMVFSPKIWINFLLTIIVCVILIYSVERNHFNRILLDIYRVFIGQSGYFKFDYYKLSIKMFFVVMTYFGMIITSVYSSSLLGTIISKRFYPEMNTLQDVHNSNLPICINSQLSNLVPDIFKQKLIILSGSELYLHIMAGNRSCAYAMMKSYAEQYIRRLRKSQGKDYYHLVKESLVPGFESFYFHQKSPFIYRINDILKTFEQSGLFLFREHDKDFKRVEQAEYMPLNLQHISTAFIILVIGLLVSYFCLIVEMLLRAFSIDNIFMKFKRKHTNFR